MDSEKHKCATLKNQESFKFHVVVRFLFMHMNMLLFLNKLEEFWETHITKKLPLILFRNFATLVPTPFILNINRK